MLIKAFCPSTFPRSRFRIWLWWVLIRLRASASVQNVSYPPFAGLLSARECIKVKSELSKMHYNDNVPRLTGRAWALAQGEIIYQIRPYHGCLKYKIIVFLDIPTSHISYSVKMKHTLPITQNNQQVLKNR